MSDVNFSAIKRFIVVALAASVVLGGAAGGAVGYFAASSAVGKLPDFQKMLVAKKTEPETAKSPAEESPTKPVPAGEESSLSGMVKNVTPSVVSIVISKEVAATQYADPFNGFDIFGFGGQALPDANANAPKEKQTVGSGSGFIISADGLIVTNRHVVADASATYTVVLADGKKYDAKVLARDTSIDLALIKIDGKNLPALSLGDSDKLELGQTVVAIGNSLGQFSNSVTRGIVSGMNRRIVAGDALSGSEVIDQAIQTDAAINPGNSGGPLLTLEGKVVGVNTAVSQQGQSVGFAIPINIAKRSIDSVVKTGRIIRPYLGVRYVALSPEMSKTNQLPVDYGALISRGNGAGQVAVVPGSPADKAGLVENDIITEVDGVKIDDNNILSGLVAKKNVGDKAVLKVYRKGDYKTVTVILSEMPRQ
jgi:serine protease Do